MKGGGQSLFNYYKNHGEALMAVYPDYQWDLNQFRLSRYPKDIELINKLKQVEIYHNIKDVCKILLMTKMNILLIIVIIIIIIIIAKRLVFNYKRRS